MPSDFQKFMNKIPLHFFMLKSGRDRERERERKKEREKRERERRKICEIGEIRQIRKS